MQEVRFNGGIGRAEPGTEAESNAGAVTEDLTPFSSGGRKMKVTWDENICTHSGECVKNLPEVFKINDGK